jgi:hypothetical protein
MPALLLVTGSRVLTEHTAARLWCEEELVRDLVPLGPGAVVMTGGASGPDDWSTAMAEFRDLRWLIYHATGHRQASWEDARLWRTEGPLTDADLRADPSLYLRRDDAMVAAALAAHERGWAVRVLGLKASWSKTDGTGYTLRAADKAGLAWRRAEVSQAWLDGWAP